MVVIGGGDELVPESQESMEIHQTQPEECREEDGATRCLSLSEVEKEQLAILSDIHSRPGLPSICYN